MPKIKNVILKGRKSLKRNGFEYGVRFLDESGQEVDLNPEGGGADADVTAHEAAENPHPQYFHRDQPIVSSTSTPEGDSTYTIHPMQAVGQATTPIPTGDPEVEASQKVSWQVAAGGLVTRQTMTQRPAENPNGYLTSMDQKVSLTPGGMEVGLTQTVYNEEGYSQGLLSGANLKFPQEGTSRVALPVTGDIATPETLATQEWVQANSGAPSLVEVTITDGTEVTEFGTLNKWTVTAPVTLTLPEVVEGAGRLVHVDFLDRITWPAGTEVHGDTEGLTEAWLSLVGDDGHWTVLVSSAEEGGLPTGVTITSEGFATEEYGDDDSVRMVQLLAEGLSLLTQSASGRDGIVLTSQSLIVVAEDGWSVLAFPIMGEAEEGAPSAQTIATQEWVESQTPLPKSVAAVEDLAGHTSVEDGHSTLVVALGKPVWSLGSTFVDAVGTQVWPT